MLAPLVDKIPRETAVLLLPGQIIELHERHLDDLVTRVAMELPLFRAEGLIDQVHIPQHGI